MNQSQGNNLDDAQERILDSIIDEVIELQQQKVVVKLEHYIARYPNLEHELREIWPAITAIDHVVPRTATSVADNTFANDEVYREFPKQLGDFELIEELGRGGMGTVYSARQISLNRPVALKILSRALSSNPKNNARFLREAQSAARLQHPRIVPVFGNGQDRGYSFYAMQLIEGASLSLVLDDVRRLARASSAVWPDVIAANPRNTQLSQLLFMDSTKTINDLSSPTIDDQPASDLSYRSNRSRSSSSHSLGDSTVGKRAYFQNVANLAKQVADALHYAHLNKTIHRDVKPSNLMLDTQGGIWITDFGLAKLESESALTKAGDVVGTLRYVAPEQLMGVAAPSCDIYGLGATLYEMITLQPVILSNDHAQILEQIRNQEPLRPTNINRQIPRDLETITLKAIAKSPSNRYRTAKDLADDLQRFLDGRPIQARQTGNVERIARWCRRNPMVASLLGMLMLVVVAGFVGVWSQWSRAEAKARSEALARAESEQALYRSKIARAQLEWRANNVRGAEQILDNCPPSQRGWEWNYLKQLNHPELFSLTEHKNWVFDVAYSPDGKLIASAGGGNPFWQVQGGSSIQPGEVFLWDTRTGELLKKLVGHTNVVHALTFNREGTKLVTGSADRLIKIWDIASGKELQSLSGHDGVIRCVDMSSDGKFIASGSEDHSVKYWDVATGQAKFTYRGHTDWVRGVKFGSNDSRIFSVVTGETARVGELLVWDTESGMESSKLEANRGFFFDVAVSPDGQQLAASSDQGVSLWDLTTGQLQRVLTGHSGESRSVAYSADGIQIASAGADSSVRVWNLRSGKDTFLFRGHTGSVLGVGFSPDGQRLVSSGDDGTVKVWDLTLHPEYCSVNTSGLLGFTSDLCCIDAMAFSADGKTVTAVRRGFYGSSGVATKFDSQNFSIIGKSRIEVTNSWMTPAEPFSLDAYGQRIAGIGIEDRTIARVWEVSSGKEIAELRGHKLPLWHAAISLDGTLTATAGYLRTKEAISGELKVWDSSTGKVLFEFAEPNIRITRVTFNSSVKDRVLAVASLRYDEQDFTKTPTSTIQLFDIQSGRLVKSISGHGDFIAGLNFDSQNKRLAMVGANKGTVIIHDLESGKEIFSTIGPTSAMDVAFSPDGMRLIVAGRLMLKLLDAATAEEILILRGLMQAVYNTHGFNPRVRFSPDGKRIVAVCHDSDDSMSIWTIDESMFKAGIVQSESEQSEATEQPEASLVASATKLADAEQRGVSLRINGSRFLELPADKFALDFQY